jgi:hypothetical protein
VGDRTEPCGTPACISLGIGKQSLITVRIIRNAQIQFVVRVQSFSMLKQVVCIITIGL